MQADERDGGDRIPVLYLAPWVGFGGADKGTLDWFRWLDRDRFAPSLITTQPSTNRRLAELEPYAREVWALPDLMPGAGMPHFVFDFIDSRGIEVIHVMNARLGFELLPDLAALPRPPRTVVQLHVEEPSKEGYVRAVTTRYGNLVDAFSVSSEHLAAAVEGYGVAHDRIHVIRTGVDAEEEFSPQRVAPVGGLEEGPLRILWPARLAPQKDPLLAVEVAAALRASGQDFRLHMVGGGALDAQVREAVAARELQREVRLHPPTAAIARWYAACDVVLMTSEFEGVPYVAHEAMAMGVPLVVPALPGNVELMGERGGALVAPRDDVAGYVAALRRLADDPALRRRVGEEARAHAVAELSVREMGRAHGELYERLLRERPLPPPPADPPPLPPPLALPERPADGEPPLVSIVIPCFNHGRHLDGLLASIERQTHPRIETILVDDASTEAGTIAAIAEIERAGRAQVIRQPRNAGPGAARNVGIAAASGRYVLPFDADNLLVEDAVEQLVAQLRAAPPEVAFVYPNLQFFGNRDDRLDPPEWDPHLLLRGNFCDTSSLYDRALFDAGLRFREDLGHEDWELALTIAERGLRGERARVPTTLYRSHGFSRTYVIEFEDEPSREQMRARHPALYGRAEHLHPFVTAKARAVPELSILALGAGADGERLARLLAAQTCQDAELLAFADEPWTEPDRGARLRRLPVGEGPTDRLERALAAARGRLLVATRGDGESLLRRPETIERSIRAFAARKELTALVFAAGADGGYAWRPLGRDEVIADGPHAVAWRRAERDDGVRSALVREHDEVGALVRALVLEGGTLDWRHLDAPSQPPQPQGGERPVELAREPAHRAARPLAGAVWPPALPAAGRPVRRWQESATWMPPLTIELCRHRERGGERRVVTNSRDAADGWVLEHVLGAVRTIPDPGTAHLHVLAGEDEYLMVGPGRADAAPAGAMSLGHLDLTPLPLVNPVVLARHPHTGQQVLVAGEEDPLAAVVAQLAVIGYVEPVPLRPYAVRAGLRAHDLRGLTRGVDSAARRHRYGIAMPAPGEPAGELGALLAAPRVGTEPLWLTADGLVVTERHRPVLARPGVRHAASWVREPLGSDCSWTWGARARAAARRALQTPRQLTRRRTRRVTPPSTPPAGHLLRDPGSGRLPLYAALHPITQDQLLTTRPEEAAALGYGPPALLGHLLAQAPVTGELGVRAVAVPWAAIASGPR